MDASSFDRLSRFVASVRSRRSLGGLALGIVAGLGGITAAAAPCPRAKKRCKSRCIPKRACCTNADCPRGSGKVCRRGRCACPKSKKRCRNRCFPKAACCTACLPGQVCKAGICCYLTTGAFLGALAPGGPAVIRLCPGTAYRGNFELQRTMVIVGSGPTSTILDGDGTGRPVAVASNVAVELQGLQLTNGLSNPGGGIRVLARATATLRGCLVRGNTALTTGGGFHNQGTLVLIDTVVSGNTADFGGGGTVTDPGGGANPTLILSGATQIVGNQVSGQGGGLSLAGAGTTVELRDDAIVIGNFASTETEDSGGGIFNNAATPASIVFFDRSRVTANTPNNCTGVTCPS